MASARWPASLPQWALQRGFRSGGHKTNIRSEMGYGPAKVRRRTSSDTKPVTISIHVTQAQLDTLESFYNTTLEMGALAFEWVDFETKTDPVDYRFLSRFTTSVYGYDTWTIAMSLERMP